MNNKKEKKNISQLFSGRRFKYGSLAVAFTACFIAVIILVNAVITSLFTKYGVYSDFTKSSIYTLNEEAEEYLQYINNDIDIKFAVPLDTIKSSSMLNMVYMCALEYQEATKDMEHKITVSYFDSYLYPAQFAQYKELVSGDWQSTNVIIETPNNVPIVYTVNSFFSSYEGEIVGFSGDRKFMSAFLQLAGIERPVVCFTVGHGEVKGTQKFDTNGNYAGYELGEDDKYKDFFTMFADAGFELRWIDLLKEDIPSECRLLVILDPKTDFYSSEEDDLFAVSELDKVSTYMAKENAGSTMIFKGSTGYEFPLLDEFLGDWGLEIDSTKTVKESAENSISIDGSVFSVQYTTEGLGTSLQKRYRDLRTVFKNASPMRIQPNFETDPNTITSALFTTSGSASVAGNDGNGYQTGKFDLMTLTTKHSYVDGDNMYSYLAACGCPEMLEYVGSPSFANRGVINAIINKLPLKNAIVGWDFKEFENYGLTSITSEAVTAWTVVLAVVMPLCVTVVGCVVVIRRKRR